MFGGVTMKSGKIMMALVFMTIFAIFVYQVVSLGSILLQNRSAMKESGIESLAGEDDVVIRSGLPNSNQLVFSCNVDWGEEVIPDLLSTLNDHNVKITFFVSGKKSRPAETNVSGWT